jgi:hypothetical protein
MPWTGWHVPDGSVALTPSHCCNASARPPKSRPKYRLAPSRATRLVLFRTNRRWSFEAAIGIEGAIRAVDPLARRREEQFATTHQARQSQADWRPEMYVIAFKNGGRP